MTSVDSKPILLSELLSGWIQGVFVAAFPELDEAAVAGIGVSETANPAFGDYQCNAAMPMAKILRKKPRDIAQAVVAAVDDSAFLDRVEIAGPGFINLHLKTEWLAERLEGVAGDARLGVPDVGTGRTVVMDYSSPNVAKPMHIGHIRSTIIGNALDRLYRFLGYRVVADNHIGDWGTQFGILIMGHRHFADAAALAEAPVEELERVYVKSVEKGDADDTWMDACRSELVKLQAGDPENTALWRQFVDLSLKEFDGIYRRLDVSFDHIRGESFYSDRLPGTVKELQEKGLAEESDGAQVVFLDEDKTSVCIVQKSDGAFNYATTDLATVASRVEEFAPERIVYVTDERQQDHFRKLFEICRRLGNTTQLDHVWFGLMRLPEMTISTRKGNVIKLERLLDEAETRALDVVKASSPDMPEAEQKDVARAVGIGAIKYMDLSQNPQTLVTFTWKKALALDGNSGPYLQYAYARIASVRDKYAERFPDAEPDDYPICLGEPVERTLTLKLLRFPEAVVYAANNYKPSTLADYLYDVAQTYSTFYQNVPFLKAEEGTRESRVRLCGLTASVLSKGLALLGIETPERI